MAGLAGAMTVLGCERAVNSLSSRAPNVAWSGTIDGQATVPDQVRIARELKWHALPRQWRTYWGLRLTVHWRLLVAQRGRLIGRGGLWLLGWLTLLVIAVGIEHKVDVVGDDRMVVGRLAVLIRRADL